MRTDPSPPAPKEPRLAKTWPSDAEGTQNARTGHRCSSSCRINTANAAACVSFQTVCQKLKPFNSSVFLEHKILSSCGVRADMMKQSIHSSCSPGHALALAGMDRAVTARVSVITAAAASKV